MTSTTTSPTSTTMTDLTFHSVTRFGADLGMKELLEAAGMISTDVKDAQIIVFNGGADIATSIYGERPIGPFIPENKSARDLLEVGIFEQFHDPSILKVGICRGSQLLNCLNGGTLWQDVNGHQQSHKMTFLPTGEIMEVTSTHHQMMRPGPESVVLGYSDEATRKTSDGSHFPAIRYPDDHRDTEIVWYPKTSTLCIQGHPEYIPGSRFAEFSIELIRHYQKETQRCVV
jgi:Peptidase C26